MGKKIIRRSGKIVSKERARQIDEERKQLAEISKINDKARQIEEERQLAEISKINDLQEIEEEIMNELKLGQEEYLPLTWEIDLMRTTDMETATQLINKYKSKLQEEIRVDYYYYYEEE